MKIALISPYSTISAFGLRSISACLKRDGHDVKLIFLPQKSATKYPEGVLLDLVELVTGSDLIGISVMTNYFENAVQLTSRLKQEMAAPVIWGGIHPTIRPEECLDHADMVCLGEAESAASELARKMHVGESHLDVEGIWFKEENGVVKNALSRPLQDLDSIPFQDYDYCTHYIQDKGRIRVMDEGLMAKHLRGDYLAHATRGCPFGCTYCCNNTLNRMYSDQKEVVRKRSMPKIIAELLAIRNMLSFVKHITFDDDSFFCYSVEEIADFSKRYEESIGLPLEIRGVSPATLTRQKLSLLVSAGLTSIRLGVQTASERTKELYRRLHSNKKVEECVELIHEFRDKIPLPRYDIIVNNPWETDEDLTETLMFFASLPTPYLLNMFSLTFYPGTELYDKAVADRIITDDLDDVYRKSYNVRAAGTSGRLIGESYMNNLLYLLYVYSLNGRSISTKTWSTLANRRSGVLKRGLLLFFVRFGGGLLLKKRLVCQAYAAAAERGSRGDEYALD